MVKSSSTDSASAIIIHKDKILLFHRDNIATIPHPDCWQIPGGGIEPDEDPGEAVERELQEEVSYVPNTLQQVGRLTRTDGTKGYIYLSFVNDDDARKFKLGKGEGQEIGFFTIDKAIRLKLTPTVSYYLPKLRLVLEDLMLKQEIPTDFHLIL